MVAKLAGIGLSAVLTVGALATPTQARDDDTTFVSPLIGSNPNMTIGGVTSGGAAWKVRKGQATLEDNGRLEVEVLLGLLLVATNTTGPVVEVAASLVCGGSGGSVAAQQHRGLAERGLEMLRFAMAACWPLARLRWCSFGSSTRPPCSPEPLSRSWDLWLARHLVGCPPLLRRGLQHRHACRRGSFRVVMIGRCFGVGP